MNYLDQLMEIELETESKFVMSLCEAIRGLDVSESEMATLDSFIQWASNFRGYKQDEPDKESESVGVEVNL